jgi:tetratricopeptide (TPR) repeat protein
MSQSSTPATPPSATTAESFELTLPDDPASNKDWYLWAGVLAIMVFVAFFPAVTGSLLWDDDHHVGLIAALNSLDGLKAIWTPQHGTPQYYPLTFTTFWLEYHLWKDNTLGYHLGNLLLHALSSILVWRLLKRLAVPGAWIAAAIWAVHPLQAESVCWMSERKNVLSGLLFFASIWFYLEYAGLTPPPVKRGPGLSADRSTYLLGNRALAYAASLICLILGLLAKTVVCAMPAAMLIILWWKGRKVFNRKTLLPLIPFFAAGLALSALTVFIETSPGGTVEAHGPDWALSPIQRLLIAGRGVWFYVVKLIWPAPLMFSYPRPWPSIAALGQVMYALQWLYVIAAIALVAILWIARRRIGRGPLAAVLYYGVTLFPALGFINIFPMRYSFVADHFQYLSGLGLIVLAVVVISRGVRSLHLSTPAVIVPVAVILLAFSTQSWLQAHIYESPLALYQDTLAKNPDSWMAADNLGIELIKLGEQRQQDYVNDQLANQPELAQDDKQESQGAYAEAESLFRKVLVERPINYAAHNSLGLLYRQLQRWPEAEAELRIAVAMDEQDSPDHQLTAPYVNLANVLVHNHPDIDVRPWLDKALSLAGEPRVKTTDVAEIHFAYGRYWFAQAGADSRAGKSEQEVNDLTQAISHYDQGLEAIPDDSGALFDLGRAYQRLGLIDQDKADRAVAAGDLSGAAEFEYNSHHRDDALAMAAYSALIAKDGQHIGAAEGMGELYVRNIVERDNLAEALSDLILATGYFQTVLKLDPGNAVAAQNMKVIARDFMTEGQKLQGRQGSWAVLKDKLQSLQTGPISHAAIISADQAARDVLWPLSSDHPLRQPLLNLRAAINDALSATPPKDADKNIHDAVAVALKAWNDRVPARDAVSDDMLAATCFEGAVTADEHSTAAWDNLKSTTQLLSQAMTRQSDVPGAQAALDRANFILDQHRAATQPSTLPT